MEPPKRSSWSGVRNAKNRRIRMSEQIQDSKEMNGAIAEARPRTENLI
jgi:hypothetical protein